ITRTFQSRRTKHQNQTESNIQYLRGQVIRRERLLFDLKNQFYKEVFILKNQVFEKNRKDKSYSPDQIDVFNPNEWLQNQIESEKQGIGTTNEIQKRKIVSDILKQKDEQMSELQKKMDDKMRVWQIYIIYYLWQL
ncbi:MAG: hypothetical protein EZS28_012307, partial [Streblomastix strix]